MKSAEEELANDLTKFAKKVDQFQEKVQGMPIPATVTPLSESRKDFRTLHLREEIDEFEKAWTEGNTAQQVDALVDLVYVAIGAILEMGVRPKDPFNKVHDANMQKIRGETKRPGSLGFDAVKPEGWKPPDIEGVLEDLDIRYAVSAVLIDITRLRRQKAIEYNNGSVQLTDHFPLGDDSYFTMVWIKAIRLRSMIEAMRAGVVFKPGRLREELRDLLNYSTYWTEDIDRREKK